MEIKTVDSLVLAGCACLFEISFARGEIRAAPTRSGSVEWKYVSGTNPCL